MSDKNIRKSVGLILAGIHDLSKSRVVSYICSEAQKHNIQVFVFNAFNDLFYNDNNSKGAGSIYDDVGIGRLAAYIILSETIKDKKVLNRIVSDAKEKNVPVVTIDGRIDGCFNVLYDYSNAFEKIVRHIVEDHKCTRVNFLAGIKGNDFSEERVDVFKRVLAENNIEFDERRLGYGDFWDAPAEKAVNAFLDSGLPLPEAIICANDAMAMTACRVLHNRGYSVPGDIMVTGFDGIEQEKYHTPRLTTAYQDKKAAAKTAVNAIVKYLETGVFETGDKLISYQTGCSQSCGCKPIVFTNVNELVMSFYDRLRVKDEFFKDMDSVNNHMTDCETIEAACECLGSHIGALYADSVCIAVRTSVIDLDPNAVLEEKIAFEEPMTTVVKFGFAYGFEVPMTQSPYGRTPPFIAEMIERGKPILYFPIHYQEKIYGYIAIGFEPEWIKFENLYNFSSSLNHSFDTIRSKAMMLKVNNMLSESNKKLEEMYIHDSLTELYNRRGFYKELVNSFNSESGRPKYIFVSSIDLDGLKYINDNFGHKEGDYAIRAVAGIINSCTGEKGICARFGGDEFMAVIFADDKDDEYITGFAERLEAAVKKLNEESGKEYEIGASCGTEIDAVTDNMDIDEIMKKADDKMYERKAHTRHFRGRPRD